MLKIFTYLSSLIFCLSVFTVNAQNTKKLPDKIKTPLFNGITIQADVASVVSSALSTGESYSYEAGAQVDLKHKFYPIVELGYAGANKTSNDNINFNTQGVFGRIGVDINLITSKKDEKPTTNLFLAGVRLGMTRFLYNINNVTITDDYWGETQTFNYSNVSSTKIWYEIVAGVRVEVTKNIFMGWTIRSKNLLTQDVSGEVAPWFIPGFGTNNGSNWGFNYTIGYKLQIPFKAKQAVILKKSKKP